MDKKLIISLLIFYILMDLHSAYELEKRNPMCVRKFLNILESRNSMFAAVISGLVCYLLYKRL